MIYWIALVLVTVVLAIAITYRVMNRKIEKMISSHEVEIIKTESSWFHSGWEDGREYEQRELERKQAINRLI